MRELNSIAAIILIAAVSMAAGSLRAQDTAIPNEVAELVWIGVEYVSADESGSEYLIGTVAESALAAIELGTYEARFLRVANLRTEETDDAGKTVRYWDCSDSYDLGTILIDTERIVTIQFKKGDPLEIAAKLGAAAGSAPPK